MANNVFLLIGFLTPFITAPFRPIHGFFTRATTERVSTPNICIWGMSFRMREILFFVVGIIGLSARIAQRATSSTNKTRMSTEDIDTVGRVERSLKGCADYAQGLDDEHSDMGATR